MNDAKEFSDVVWIQTSFIGDIVLSTAAMDLAARTWPTLPQHVVTTRVGAEVLKGFSPLASVTVFEKRGESLAGAVSAFRSVKAALRRHVGPRPVLLQAHRSFRSSILARYLGWPSVTYDESDLSWLATRRVPRVSVLHETARVGLLLEPLGMPRAEIVAARPKLLPLAEPSDVSLAEALRGLPRPYIGIAPGSVWGTKRWTEEGYVELVKSLVDREGGEGSAGIILIGAKDERALCESIATKADRAGKIVNLAGKTSLGDLRWLFCQLALLVGNDSSPLHFAAAFDVPTVGIFGATVPEMGFGPAATTSRAVGVKGLVCRPCSAHGPDVCPLGHFKCMRTLPAKTVHEAVSELLKR